MSLPKRRSASKNPTPAGEEVLLSLANIPGQPLIPAEFTPSPDGEPYPPRLIPLDFIPEEWRDKIAKLRSFTPPMPMWTGAVDHLRDNGLVVITAEDAAAVPYYVMPVLKELLKAHPSTLTQEELAPISHLTERTVRRHLKTLSKRGIVWQPAGPKGGFTLTAKGLHIVQKAR